MSRTFKCTATIPDNTWKATIPPDSVCKYTLLFDYNCSIFLVTWKQFAPHTLRPGALRGLQSRHRKTSGETEMDLA